MTPKQAEDLRHAVREFLAVRFPTAHSPRAILRSVAKEVDFPANESDVIAACEFLVGFDQVKKHLDPLGSSQHFSATASGVQAHERGS